MPYYLKVFFLSAVLFVHGMIAAAGKVIFCLNKRACVFVLAHLNSAVCAALGFIIGVHVKKTDKIKRHKKPVLYVGNHLSYLDVLAIGCCYPILFVTSVDMGERKSEGWITSNAGSVYVERRRDKLDFETLKKNVDSIKKIILLNGALCIFPEATSANNAGGLLFHSSLFSSVENTETTIVPFFIKYLSIEGRPLSKENESIVYFYKGQKFIPHVKRLLRYGNIKVEITVLPSFGANGRSRKEICRLCRDMITQRLDEATPLRGAATL